MASKTQAFWTQSEIQILVNKYPVMKVSAISELLPRHSIYGIVAKAREIGLRVYRSNADYKMLIAMGHSNAEIAELLGCCTQNVSYHRNKLNTTL